MTKIDYKCPVPKALISKTFKNAMLSYFLINLQIILILHLSIQTGENQ